MKRFDSRHREQIGCEQEVQAAQSYMVRNPTAQEIRGNWRPLTIALLGPEESLKTGHNFSFRCSLIIIILSLI